MKRYIGIILAILLLTSLVLTACAKATPAPAPAPTTTSTAPAQSTTTSAAPKPSATTTTAAPAQPAKTFKWNLQTFIAQAALNYQVAERIGKEITSASNGRLSVAVFPAGGIVTAMEEIQGLDKGLLQIAVHSPDYAEPILPGSGIYCFRVGGLTAIQYMAWYLGGPGTDLIKKKYEPIKNVEFIGFVHHNASEIWCHSTKPITSLADLQKLKLRTSGDGAKILGKMGVSTVIMAGGELYQAVKSGVIDALEYSTASTNWPMGFHEVAPYMYLSPTRTPSAAHTVFVNKQAFAELTPDLQQIVRDVVAAQPLRYFTEVLYADAAALEKYKTYGTKIAPLPKDIDDALLAEAAKFYADMAAKDPLAAEVIRTQNEAKKVCEANNLF